MRGLVPASPGGRAREAPDRGGAWYFNKLESSHVGGGSGFLATHWAVRGIRRTNVRLVSQGKSMVDLSVRGPGLQGSLAGRRKREREGEGKFLRSCGVRAGEN